MFEIAPPDVGHDEGLAFVFSQFSALYPSQFPQMIKDRGDPGYIRESWKNLLFPYTGYRAVLKKAVESCGEFPPNAFQFMEICKGIGLPKIEIKPPIGIGHEQSPEAIAKKQNEVDRHRQIWQEWQGGRINTTSDAFERDANRNFRPSFAAQKWLADLAMHLKMKQQPGEELWQFKNRMYATIQKKENRNGYLGK